MISLLFNSTHTGDATAQCQLQLVGGFGASAGFLQVFVGQWSYVSLPSPNNGDAVCQQLGFEGALNMSMVTVSDGR